MAFIAPQYQIDMQQQAQSDKNQAAIGGAIINGLEVNRQRALEAKRQREAKDIQALTFAQAGAEPEAIKAWQETGDTSALQSGFSQLKQASLKRESEDLERKKRVDEATINEKNAKAEKYRKGGAGTGQNYTFEEKLDIKAKKDEELLNKKRQDPQYRLEQLGAEGRNKVGSIASGLQSLDQMIKASDDGLGPEIVDGGTPLLGRFVSDTPYTSAERVMNEVVGRLQSGGAIGVVEGDQFRAMGPRTGDSKEERTRKLAMQRDFLNNKLAAFGFKGEELSGLGMKTSSDYVSRNAKMAPKQTAQITAEDQAAIQWASANPKDPRAAAILQMHGVK